MSYCYLSLDSSNSPKVITGQRRGRVPPRQESDLDRHLGSQLHRPVGRRFHHRSRRAAIQLVIHAQELLADLQPIQQHHTADRPQHSAGTAVDLEHGIFPRLQHDRDDARFPRPPRHPASNPVARALFQIQPLVGLLVGRAETGTVGIL